MKVKKVLILGLDALEYDLVEKWDLKNLKQEEYGKTILPISREDGYLYPEPATVIVWPCFITGMPPKKMGIQTVKIYPFNILYKFYLKYIYPQEDEKKKRSIKDKSVYRKLMDNISNIISSLHLSREPNREDIKVPSMFDVIPNSIHRHIPTYDKDAFPNRGMVVKALENSMYKPIFEKHAIKEFNERTKEVIEYIEKNNWNLFMEYFSVLDGIQHVFYNKPNKIAKFYLMFDEFVGKVREKIDDDTLLLIVSDHGQKRGLHTDYGFYSANKPLGLKNPKLIDFRWIIEDILGKNER